MSLRKVQAIHEESWAGRAPHEFFWGSLSDSPQANEEIANSLEEYVPARNGKINEEAPMKIKVELQVP